jgi:cytochrome P450
MTLPLGLMTLRHPDVIANPYPFYERFRREAPIFRDPAGVWLLSRYADGLAALQSGRVSANRLDQVRQLRPDAENAEIRSFFDSLKLQILFLDPPEHTRIRALVTKAFTPARVEQMRARIARIVESLLDATLPSGSMDVIADLAVPLPMMVICDMLRIPDEDRARLKRWSADYATFIGGSIMLPPDAMLALARSMAEFLGYFRELCQQRRGDPGDDLLTVLLQAEDGGTTLDRDDVCATSVLLIAAGHETTTNLIGNGLLALLRQPEALQRLREDPALFPAAVEELLRFDSPVQMVVRRAIDHIAVGGERIAAGDIFYALVGSANRDPERFANPDELDFTRPNNRHLAFGHGPHYCLGAPLARLEAQFALSALLARTKEIRLREDPPPWRPNPALRGLRALAIVAERDV